MSAGPGDPLSVARRFTDRVRGRDRIVGYWMVLGAPPAAERIATLGYDYVCLDAQHGLFGYDGMLLTLSAIEAAGTIAAPGPAAGDGAPAHPPTVGLVRVGANDQYQIGRALDAGAAGVIVPLVDDAEAASAAVSYTRYPPDGVRSYGPMRSGLRIGPDPAAANLTTTCLVMIETASGLANVEEICRVPGLAGVYVGPSDLTIAIGGARPGDPAVADEFEAALVRVRTAAAAAGIAAGIHTPSGDVAARRLAEGFTLATVSSDLIHLQQAAAGHLTAASAGAEGADPARAHATGSDRGPVGAAGR